MPRSWSVSRTVSLPIDATTPALMACRASRAVVHFARPSGGDVQANAMIRVFCFSSNKGRAPGAL